jgi:preprotein translocase SecF subunit
VVDIIGKRRWFFLFSGLVTIPGLVFLLLGPISGGKLGLQFSIDYTGGTRWEIHFKDPAVTPDRVKTVLAGQGMADAVVVSTSEGFLEIRSKVAELATPAPVPSASPVPSGSAAASGSPAASSSPASASPAAGKSAAPSASPAAGKSPGPSASPAASPSPVPSGSPAASASPSPSPGIAAGTEVLPTKGKFGEIRAALEATLGPIDGQRALATVGPVISQELTQQAVLLTILGSIGILLWMTFRFRDVKFGATALVALLHDVIVVVGTFAVLGSIFRVEIDALFVTAMLTVIGFSVHDTIVVYDRIRENKARHAGEPFDQIVNHSILQTLGRSINTSLTVVVTLTALLLFGGSAIRFFVLALLIGIVSGTYSSIFNASPLLVVWQNREDRRRGRTAVGRPTRRPTP